MDELLKKYRPAGAPAELRARILDVPAAAPAWRWAAAAAAMLAASVLLRGWTGGVVRELRDPPSDPAVAATVDLALALGGGPEDRLIAEVIMIQERIRTARATAPSPQEIQ